MHDNESIKIEGLSANFESNGLQVIKDINLSVEKGSFISIIGPSGAGKSTLLRLVLGLMKPSHGKIVKNFKEPAMVFQNHALFPWLNTLENVEFGLKMKNLDEEKRKKIAKEKLSEVGLSGYGERFPDELSGGQHQRVGLARALAISPDLLILDEPFSSLDTITSQALKKDLLSVWHTYNMTIFMVNHLIPDAVELSDKIFIMSPLPGEIKKTMHISLPRPRDTRSGEFFKYVDELTEEVRRIS